jgi:hypothetical protein
MFFDKKEFYLHWIRTCMRVVNELLKSTSLVKLAQVSMLLDEHTVPFLYGNEFQKKLKKLKKHFKKYLPIRGIENGNRKNLC